MSLKWFKFYVYIRLFFGILISLGLAIRFDNLFVWLNVILLAVLFWGLHQKELWAWKLNFGFLIYESVLNVLGQSTYQSSTLISKTSFDPGVFGGALIIYGLVWVLPNWLYFKRRKSIFKEGVNPSEGEANKNKVHSSKKDSEQKSIINRHKRFFSWGLAGITILAIGLGIGVSFFIHPLLGISLLLVESILLGSIFKEKIFKFLKIARTKVRKRWSTVLAIILLLIAIGENPYGYYQFLRWIILFIAGYSAYSALIIEKRKWIWIFGGIALLFNPVIPFHLSKEAWQFFDVVATLLFLISLFVKFEDKSDSSSSENRL